MHVNKQGDDQGKVDPEDPVNIVCDDLRILEQSWVIVVRRWLIEELQTVSFDLVITPVDTRD